MAAGRFSVEAVFKAIDKISAPVSRMQNRIGKFSRKARESLKRLNQQTSLLGKGFKTALGVAGIAGGLFLMQSAMRSAIVTGVQFEQTLVNAAAKFPEGIRKGTAEFKRLEDTARRIGATTEFTASQAAGGLNFLAMAGFNAEQSVSALPGIVDLATAAQIDLARASDIATDTLGAFNLTSKDSVQLTKNLARVNDVMAKTTTTANTDMEQLYEAMKEGGAIATTSGASIETFSAMAGVLANAMIKGSMAGTTMKNVFTRLAHPVGNAAKLLKKMRVATKDSNGNMRDTFDILGDLEKGLKGLGTGERLAVLTEIFGKIPLAGVNVLLATGADRLKQYRGELEGATGASKEMASVMRDTLQGRFNTLKSAAEGLGLTIFEGLKPSLEAGVTKLTEIVRATDQFIQRTKDVIPVVLEVGGNILKAIGILLALKLALIAINIVMAANPFGLIVTAIALLIAFAPTLIKNWDKVTDALKLSMIFWKDIFLGVIDKVKEGVSALIDLFKDSVFFKGLQLLGKVVGFEINTIKSIGAALGIGGPPEQTPAPQQERQMISPDQRMARTLEERRVTSEANLTITDQTGRASLSGNTGPGINLQLARSGAF